MKQFDVAIISFEKGSKLPAAAGKSAALIGQPNPMRSSANIDIFCEKKLCS